MCQQFIPIIRILLLSCGKLCGKLCEIVQYTDNFTLHWKGWNRGNILQHRFLTSTRHFGSFCILHIVMKKGIGRQHIIQKFWKHATVSYMNCKYIAICPTIAGMITHEANGHKATTPAIFPTHTEAFAEVVKKMTTGEGKCIDDVSEINAIGHRVVHGGEKFKASCLITDEVINTLRELSPLAPLHNPAGILGIEAARKVFGNIPMVAVFDTAFHSTMPPKAYMYAIPYEYYEKYGVRRYGFHGTSHKYVAHKAAEYLEEPIERLKLITCHLGNGSSIAAVDQGKVVDTSMGMTPLAGLMMGTRCGDLDPSVVNYLKYTLNITGHELDEILNKKSGLLGISGVSSDKRDVEEAAAAGNKRAQLASDMLNYQIKKTVGAYIAAMGGVDAIVFTGGIGEHDAIARAKVCHHMDWLGIRIDTEKNKHPVGDVCEITAWGAKVRTLVIATDEELMIARDTKEVLEK